MLFLHSYGSQLESSTFAERPADFAWFLLFTCLTTSVVGHFMHFAFMFQALLASIIYLWSQVNADRTVSFMFGLTFKAVYFPWVHFSYNYVLMDATVPWTMLVGIASAHLFYFLDSLYPDMGGPKLISTPALLYRFLPSEEVAGAEFTAGGGMAANFRLGEGEAGARRAAGPEDVSSEEASKALASTSNHYKLEYFFVSGVGAVPRDILAYSGADWEDKEITNWPAEKNSPFGVYPILHIHTPDGKHLRLCESIVVEHFLAKKFDLLGDNEWDEQQIKMFHSSSLYLRERLFMRVTW
ncbi:Derlin 1 [Podila epicladia]|nr:Derlin 1 [Podila epicladia]